METQHHRRARPPLEVGAPGVDLGWKEGRGWVMRGHECRVKVFGLYLGGDEG